MAKESKSHHIVRTMNGEWGVKREGADRATKVFPTQAAAISWAREQSIKDRSEVVIHGRDGMIREKNSYGRDSHLHRDRKR